MFCFCHVRSPALFSPPGVSGVDIPASAILQVVLRSRVTGLDGACVAGATSIVRYFPEALSERCGSIMSARDFRGLAHRISVLRGLFSAGP